MSDDSGHRWWTALLMQQIHQSTTDDSWQQKERGGIVQFHCGTVENLNEEDDGCCYCQASMCHAESRQTFLLANTDEDKV